MAKAKVSSRTPKAEDPDTRTPAQKLEDEMLVEARELYATLGLEVGAPNRGEYREGGHALFWQWADGYFFVSVGDGHKAGGLTCHEAYKNVVRAYNADHCFDCSPAKTFPHQDFSPVGNEEIGG
jgi:hypothetical protein